MYFENEEQRVAYKTWLASLKVGDKVATCSSTTYITGDRYGIDIIERISPTRKKIVLKHGAGIDEHGEEIRPRERFRTHFMNIEPITDKIIVAIKRQNILRYVEHIEEKDWKKLSPEDLETVANIFRKYEEVPPTKQE